MRVHLACDAESPLVLHWGMAWRFRHEWQLPPEPFRPTGTTLFDQQAVRTPFAERDGLQYLELEFAKSAEDPGPRGMKFVLYQPEHAAWLKSNGQEMLPPTLSAAVRAIPVCPPPRLCDLAEQIVGAEKGPKLLELDAPLQPVP